MQACLQGRPNRFATAWTSNRCIKPMSKPNSPCRQKLFTVCYQGGSFAVPVPPATRSQFVDALHTLWNPTHALTSQATISMPSTTAATAAQIRMARSRRRHHTM